MVTKNIKIMKGQFLFLFLLLAVFGCKEDEFDTYSSVNYLSFYNNPATDSIVETFFFHQGKDAIEVPVKFNLGGQLLTEDCPIKLCVVDSLSGLLKDGKVVSPLSDADFAFPDEMVFHKGMNVDSVFVVLKKTAQLEDAYCRVVLQIEPNEFFEVGETVYSQAKIYFTSAISIPGWWDETVDKYYLGGFTPRKYEIFRGGHKVYGRKVPAYDFRTSGSSPGHVPGGAAGKEKGGIGTSPLRSTDLHAHGDHRAAGVYIPLYRAASLRDSLRVRRTGVHADAHARRWSRNDILRWAHRSVSVWNPSRKQKDRVALDRCGRSLLFSHVLCGVPGSDPET